MPTQGAPSRQGFSYRAKQETGCYFGKKTGLPESARAGRSGHFNLRKGPLDHNPLGAAISAFLAYVNSGRDVLDEGADVPTSPVD